jgi:predicted acyltransferase
MPGRDIPFMDQSQNLVSWLDRHIFPGHLYLPWNPPTHDVRDPEGLLSDIPAVGTALLGLLTGLWLHGRRAVPAVKAVGLAAASVVCLASGYIWSILFPLNKNLWTSSFVLVAAGWSLAVLAVAYWAAEQQDWRQGLSKKLIWPWLVFGSNAIVAYMFSELLASTLGVVAVAAARQQHESLQAFLFAHSFTHIPNPGWAAFAYSVSFTVVCFLPVWFLYSRRIFVKV